jgi:hypothetical protein
LKKKIENNTKINLSSVCSRLESVGKMLTRSGTKSAKEILPPKDSSSSESDRSGDIDDIDDEISDEDEDDEMKYDPSDDKLVIALGLQYELGIYSKGDIVFLKEKLWDFFEDACKEAKKYGRRDGGAGLVLFNDIRHVLYTMLSNLDMKPYRSPPERIPDYPKPIEKCQIPTDERLLEIEDIWLADRLPSTYESRAYCGTHILTEVRVSWKNDVSDVSRFGENTAIAQFISYPDFRGGGFNNTQWCYSYPAILLLRDFLILDFVRNLKELNWDRRKSFVVVISSLLKETSSVYLVSQVFFDLNIVKRIVEFV